MSFSCVGDFNYLFIAMQISLHLICQLRGGAKVTGGSGDKMEAACAAARVLVGALRWAEKGELIQGRGDQLSVVQRPAQQSASTRDTCP